MLESESIYFATEGELFASDHWEGAFGAWEVLSRLRDPNFELIDAYMHGDSPSINRIQRATDDKDDELLQLAVSCWHFGASESAAMWKLYTRGQDGVAIRTSVSKLLHALRASGNKPDYGFVRYLSDEDSKRYCNGMKPIHSVLTKRAVYEHEREVRFILRSKSVIGFPCSVDLVSLIDDIVLSPDYPRWAEAALQHALERFSFTKLSKRVRQSSVGFLPLTGKSAYSGK